MNFQELTGKQANVAEIAGKLLAGLQVLVLQAEAAQSMQAQAVAAMESLVHRSVKDLRLIHALTEAQVAEACAEFLPDVLVHHFGATIQCDSGEIVAERAA